MLAIVMLACNGDKDNGDDGGPTDSGTPPAPTDACDGRAAEAFCDGDDVVTCDAVGNVASVEACSEDQTCEDGACVPCAQGAFTVGFADPVVVGAEGFRLELDPSPSFDRVVGQRPLVAAASGAVTFDGPVALYRADGTSLQAGDELTAGDAVIAQGTAVGRGSVGIEAGSCSAAVPFHVDPPHGLAGRSLDQFPWFETPDLFSVEDDVVELLVDPGQWRDRVGLPYEAWLVPHRGADGWIADPAIGAAVAGPISGVVPADASGVALLWDAPAVTGLAGSYDVVVDFGSDGTLDPGDLIDGYDTPGLRVSADLSAPGPYTPTKFETSFATWVTFLTYYPQEVDTLDPLPVVVISHGNGHDYTWYDYLGNHFASHGYVVVVHTNDTGDTSIEPAAGSTWKNTEAFLTNLATIGGGALDGHVDADRIAWIGHSRGGEGVVMAYAWLETGQITPTAYTADDLKLVVSIAPTVWTSAEVADPMSVPVYAQLDGSADGDVTGAPDSDIVEYFRIFQGHTELGAVAYVQGATHNDFNCCGFADGAGVGPGPLIGRPAAQQIARSYLLALVRASIDGEDFWWEYFSRPPERFAPPGVETPVTLQLKRAEGDRTFVIDDFQSEPAVELSSSGGAVATTASGVVQGALNDEDGDLSPSQNEPFNGMTWSESGDTRPERGLVLDWASGTETEIEWDIVADQQDWTDDTFLSFRACQRTRFPYTVALAGPLSFTVELQDADGATSAIDFGAYGGINPPFARDGSGTGVGWVNEFQTIRVPVADFRAEGTALDLSRVEKVRFRFGAAYGSDQGAIGLDDLVLLQEVLP
ncbi:MAG: hypothetical protein ABMA64_30270 [Myxococcota bacterium]